MALHFCENKIIKILLTIKFHSAIDPQHTIEQRLYRPMEKNGKVKPPMGFEPMNC
jgi:hypothetical protein